MKKILTLLIPALFLLGFSSCEKTKTKIDELTEFDINNSTTAPVPAVSYTTGMPAVEITTPEFPTNSSSQFSANKTSADLVSEIKMSKFTISTTGTNLDFLKSVSVYIKTANLGDVKVAEKTNIPSGVQSFQADLSDVNIKEYIFKDKIQFKLNLTFAGSPGSNQNLKIDQTVHVKATLIK